MDRIVGEGRVDAVVNNVGLARFGRISSIHLDDLFLTYDLNARTAVQVLQAVLPGMIDANWGRIVNVTSLTTLGTPERTPYAAAKAALETCTRIWAGELASAGITANAVAPGPIERCIRKPSTIPLHRVRYPRGDRACDLHAAARRCQLHHRSGYPRRRERREHQRRIVFG